MKHARHDLQVLVPQGLIATRTWLTAQKVSRHTVDNWVKSGQLVALVHGVFKRPEAEVSWQAVACSLQRMGINLTPGGLTALALQGMTHNVSSKESQTVYLYGTEKLPTWLNYLLPGVTFVRHRGLEIDSEYRRSDPGFHLVPWRSQFLSHGDDKWRLDISSPELAILEVLLDVPLHVTFEHADHLLQGLPTLSPQKLNRLLERCHNVKVKRLFLWLAERNQSPWFKRLDLQSLTMESGALGAGKRMIAKGGKLVAKYLITVPQEMLEEAYG